MPRKRASGSSPEKQAAPRRNTRRGRNKSETEEEAPPVVEIPKHLLRASDESSEHSDNDSDYGSPKKGRGRGKATGRGRKAKESPEKPTPRPRRGRRGAAAVKDTSQDDEEVDNNSQSTQETAETTTENEAPEPSQQVRETTTSEQEQTIADDTNTDQASPNEPSPSFATVTHVIEEEKVSEVTIEQDLQSNIDQAPVNEEERDGSKDNDDVETGRESVEDVNSSSEVVEDEKMDSPKAEQEKVIEIQDEESKDAPMSSAAQSESRSRSNSSEKVCEKRRERSSSGEVQEVSCEKMEVDSSVHILNKEKVKESLPKEKIAEVKKVEEPPVKETPAVVEEKVAPPTQRKRRWTARKTEDQPVIAITTDSLKNIISEEVKPVPLSDVKLLSSYPEPEQEEKRPRITADDKDAKKKLLKERLRKQEEEEERRNEQLVIAIDKSQASNGAGANGSALLKDRKVSIIVDDPAIAPSPPKNESSNILYITNLVRPFTVLQLKGLLARTGKIVEDGFWIDKIKSKCYVKYETEDEAIETRHALHGVTWPSSNPKCLNVDFGTEEDMDKASVSDMDDMSRIQITTENRDIKEKEFGWSKDPHKNSSVDDRTKISHNRPVREWDVGKKDKEELDREDRDRNRRKRSSERGNRRDKDLKKDDRPEKRRSLSGSPGKAEKTEGESQPVRLLDDLFRKTKATPCIYWLPLSEEQIIKKEELRVKRIAEHEERMVVQRKQREEAEQTREKKRPPLEKRRSVSRDSRRDRSRDRRRRSVSRDRRGRRDRSRDRRRRSVSRDRRYNRR